MSRWGTFVLAAATLGFETALVRVFALAQGYHLAFLAISVALLGMGAGGTLLILWSPSQHDEHAGNVLALASVGFAATTFGSYVLLNVLPFDVYRIAWERIQIAYLVANYVALTIPFFCSGLAIGLSLERAAQGNEIYASNLLGSALGCVASLGALAYLGGAGTIALSAVGGFVAAILYLDRHDAGCRRRAAVVSVLCSLGAVALLALAWVRPTWYEIRLSPYRPLSYTMQFPNARLLSSRWNAFSRVDVVESDAVHVAPGLSLSYTGRMPRQHGLFVDAQAQAAILSDDPAVIEEWAANLPTALVYRMRPEARVLVLQPGGGIEVAVARTQGAVHVTAVSSNRLVVDAVRKYGDGLYTDPNIEVVVQSPRSFVHGYRSRGETGFDVIDVALNDAQQAVVSGAYTLSEDYIYTVQALEDYVTLLKPGGLLVIQRWLQTPPSESLRAWALAVTALEQQGKVNPRQCLVAIRSWSTMLILVKNGAFDGPELQMIRQFCAERQFDLVYLPDLRPEETNRFNIYEGAPYARAFGRLLASEQRAAFYREYSYQVSPPTDDKPYYHHFFRWRQVPEIWQSLGRTWQPFGGSGYLVLVALLVVATLASAALILVPVSLRGLRFGSESDLPVFAVLVYFGCLGFAYLAVEIPLIQRIVLYVDHPTIAFATVVTVLLVASGVGSLLAPRAWIQWTVPLLVLYLVALLVLLPAAIGVLLGYSLAARLAVTSLLLAPLGLLMGIPFPAGVALLRARSAHLIPWAWGVNGCASVVASVLAPLIALEWGYGVVLGLAAAIYVAAWLIIRLAWGVKA